jgi:glucose/arabinose dehydrogenase
MSRAGAGVPSANRITLLLDANGDGKPDLGATFLKNLESPFGMALIGNTFYVANADAIMQFLRPGRQRLLVQLAAHTPL